MAGKELNSVVGKLLCLPRLCNNSIRIGGFRRDLGSYIDHVRAQCLFQRAEFVSWQVSRYGKKNLLLSAHCAIISENGLLCGHEKLHLLNPPLWNGAVTGQEILDLVRLHLWKGINLRKCSMRLLSAILLQQRGTHIFPCRSCGIKFKQAFVAAKSCASKTSSKCGSEMTYRWTTNLGGRYFFDPMVQNEIFQNSAAQRFFKAASSDVSTTLHLNTFCGLTGAGKIRELRQDLKKLDGLNSHRLQLSKLGRLLQPPEGKKPHSPRGEKGSAAQGVEYIMEVHREASFNGFGLLSKLFQLNLDPRELIPIRVLSCFQMIHYLSGTEPPCHSFSTPLWKDHERSDP